VVAGSELATPQGVPPEGVGTARSIGHGRAKKYALPFSAPSPIAFQGARKMGSMCLFWVALGLGAEPINTYEEVKRVAVALADKCQFESQNRYRYQTEPGQLAFTEADRLRLGSSDTFATYTSLQCLVEAYRKTPPPGVSKVSIADQVKQMDRLVEQYYAKAIAEKDGEKRTRIEHDAEQSVRAKISEYIQAGAKKQGRVVSVWEGIGEAIRVTTDPTGGRVYMMSDMQKVFAEMRGKEVAKEILKYAIESGQTNREGLVWYYIEWKDGKKSGPTSVKIFTRKIVLK
jgi:hypothetical protein